jgi:hypothetical protein
MEVRTMDEMNLIDEKLNRESLQTIGSLVRDLPEDVPSMAWRSALNERILAEAPKPRRAIWGWMLRPAVGLSVAAALAAVVIFRPAPSATEGVGIESVLIQMHQEETRLSGLTGAGMTVTEMREFANPTPVELDPYLDLDVL